VECLRWTVALKGISVASTTVGAKRMFMLIVALALLFVIPPHVDAGEKPSDPTKSETRPGAASLPSDEQLDALLAARNWDGLVTAFEGVRSDESLVRALDWLDARINSGGGSLLGFLYTRFLWDLRSPQNVNDPDKDPRLRAGLMVLYTLQLIIIDGTKCADQSAPGHRIDQLLADYGPVIQYLKTKRAKLKAKVIDAAIALEKRTAPLRKDDDLLCRGGLEEMMAGIEAGRTNQVPTPPDQIGKTIVVDPPPDYAPKFVAPETYKPMQAKARSEIRSDLLKMLQ
jgi:hypothetical protein